MHPTPLVYCALTSPPAPSSFQGDFLVHLMEVGEGDASTPLAALAPHQLQGLLESALRASSLAASPHVDVVGDGALAIRMDKRSILQLVTAATVSNSSSRGAQQVGTRAGARVSVWSLQRAEAKHR